MRILSAVLLALLCTSSAFGITHRPDKPDQAFIDYGKKHDCVVRIKCMGEKCLPLHFGSGTVIAPRVIVTAAHVVHGGVKQAAVYHGEDYEIIASVCPEKFTMEMEEFGKYDIAVCYLGKPIELNHYPPLYTKSDEDGKICSIAGWGRDGTFTTGYSIGTPSLLRAGSNFVDHIEHHLLVCKPSKARDGTRMTSLEAIVAPGDSGGGLFIDGKLAGVHSMLMTNPEYKGSKKLDGGYGCMSASTRVSIYNDWILKTAEQIEGHFLLMDQINDKIEAYKEYNRTRRGR